MQRFSKILLATGLSLGLATAASANSAFVAADDNITSQICVVALEGSKAKLNRVLKQTRLTKQYVVDNVTCNGTPITEFVAQNGNNPDSINAYITNGNYASDDFIARVEN